MLIGSLVPAQIWPVFSARIFPLGTLLGHGTAHFLVYIVAACLAMLVWSRWHGFAVSLGTAVLSVVLQIIRAQAAGIGIDKVALIVNLLGTAAGVLLGLNLLSLQRSQAAEPDQAG